MPYRILKRFLDLAIVVVTLPVILPLVSICGAVFFLMTGERPVYRQTRTGLGNRKFRLWKLKTMTETRAEDGTLLPDHERLTPFGNFMRATSIDELPQIINILKGEMSFVGPRPQIDVFLDAMTEKEQRRHEVLPGLTGHAQINGRNAVTWAQRFEMDVWYVENASLWLDLTIMARTPFVVLGARNTKHTNHATMPTLFEERDKPAPKNQPASSRSMVA